MPVINVSVFFLVITVSELTAQTCPPVSIANGFTRLKAGGKVIRYFCNRGFNRLGKQRATCRSSGWSEPPPICYAPGCSVYHKLENGNITAYETSLMAFKCHEGYILMGYDAMFCNGTSWSSELPECKVPADIDHCDLEYNTVCGWSQDKDDDFDWTWHRGQTQTGWTGPKHDHTYQNLDEDGHYLYLEMSSPRMRGDVARLISPQFDSSRSGRCFELWYHMLGPGGPNEVGSLKIIVRNLITEENTTLLEIAGNQGDVWLSAEVYIQKINESFQIIIEGRREKAYVGDIAVDDFRFYNCTVLEETTSSAYRTDLTTESEKETHVKSGTTSLDIYTSETTDLEINMSTELFGVKTEKMTVAPPLTPRSVSSQPVSLSSVTVLLNEKSKEDAESKIKAFTTLKEQVQNEDEISTEYNTHISKSDGTTAVYISTSDVRGSGNKSTLYVTESGIIPTLAVTGSGSIEVTRSVNIPTVQETGFTKNSSSLQNLTKNNLKSGDLTEYFIQDKTFIVIVSVCTFSILAVIVAVIVFICRKRKSQESYPLEEMKTHFVYKKSVDLTVSSENMTEVCKISPNLL